MLAIKVEISRFVDDHQPGFVECWFEDVRGVRHFFVEKVPVLTSAYLDATSVYPADGFIDCELVEHPNNRDVDIRTVSTRHPWDIESTEGLFRFDVQSSQLVEL
jgi:hypothetical protein